MDTEMLGRDFSFGQTTTDDQIRDVIAYLGSR